MSLVALSRAVRVSRSTVKNVRQFGSTPAPGAKQVPLLPEIGVGLALAGVVGGAWMGVSNSYILYFYTYKLCIYTGICISNIIFHYHQYIYIYIIDMYFD